MKKILQLTLISVLFFVSCRSTSYTPTEKKNTRQEYIALYAPLAMKEMQRTGIPASIKLAQAILESGDGNSRLATRGNNHFGIKCHEWIGRRIFHDDDERGECFRRYRSPENSFRDHSEFLTNRSRYAFLFDLDPADYVAWATGLKNAGYATHPEYDKLLIRIIEENQLYQFDGQNMRRGRMQVAGTVTTETGSNSLRKVEIQNNIRYIVAKEGETFTKLTRELGLMSWELPKYNETQNDRILREGEIVYLQPKRNRAGRGNDYHIVQEGETLYMISQKYGVKMDRLLRMNRLNPGKDVSPGDEIWLRKNKPSAVEDQSPVRIEFEL